MPKGKTKTKSKSKSCGKGQIYRSGYNRTIKSGKKISVPGGCITSTAQNPSKMKRSEIDRRYIEDRHRNQARAAKISRSKSNSMSRSSSCPKGQIMRAAYERKPSQRKAFSRESGTKIAATNVKGSIVPETCIQGRGKPKLSRGKQLFHLEKDVLKPYGYENVKNLSVTKRHRALNRALKDGIKPLPLFRRINALYVLNEYQDPEVAKIFKSDRDWIKTTHEYMNRPTARSKSSRSRTQLRTQSRSGFKTSRGKNSSSISKSEKTIGKNSRSKSKSKTIGGKNGRSTK